MTYSNLIRLEVSIFLALWYFVSAPGFVMKPVSIHCHLCAFNFFAFFFPEIFPPLFPNSD
jgi:hypothetical protein